MAKANEIISLISGLTEEQLERLKSQIPPAEAGGLISPLKAVVG